MTDEPKTAQINVRAPEAAREFLLNLAARLRGDPTFLPRAEAWLVEVEDPTAGPSLAERVENLEAAVERLTRDRG